jgi:ADP-heptose:LPS heptosyltransferase
MGDVLLTLPVMQGILRSNTDVQLIFVTRKKFSPYFGGIDRLIVVPFDPDGPHRGLSGLWRIFGEIRRYPFRRVVDLHGMIRTWFLDAIFLLTGCRVYRIRKHRKLRRKILGDNQLKISVPHTSLRYQRVFKRAGLTGGLSPSVFPPAGGTTRTGRMQTDLIRVGIAPISKHTTKNWGLNNIAELIGLLKLRYSVEIHLFGGKEDQIELNSLLVPDVFNQAGIIETLHEISLIQTLDVFISMDSANMHLAALAGIPTLSIWGATDPRLGFAPLFQPDSYALFADPSDVICRPCSVYGEIPCKRKDSPMICMNSIKPEQVMNKISEILILSDKN